MSGLIFWVGENQALLATLFAVAALLFMITAARIHAFPALVAAALFAASGLVILRGSVVTTSDPSAT